MADFSYRYKQANNQAPVRKAHPLPVNPSRPRQGAISQMTGQYNFPPPPPPPGHPPPNQHPQHYGYPQQQQHQPSPYQPQRGGGTSRGGRGGNHSRGDFHGNAPYNSQTPSGAYDPRHPQQVQPQAPPTGYSAPNGQQNSTPYLGPQTLGPQAQGVGVYPAPQWQNNHGSPHGQPQHAQHLPVPSHGAPAAPLSTQNYHPNYAPQYQQPQYGPQPPPFQHQPPSFGHSVPPNHQSHGGPPHQWQAAPQQNRAPFNNNRGRGGFTGVGRGGHEPPAPLMGPPIRMGFDNDRGGGHMAQAGNGFPQPYANHATSPAPFPQPLYQGYPPQEYSHGGQRPPLDPNPFNSPLRGRGGNNFRGRGRGDFQHQPNLRGRNDIRHRSNGVQRQNSDNFHKPAGADANGKKKKKRRTNTLGLTPNGVDHEESEDEIDDIDEEVRLVTLLGPDTPQLPTDLDVWLAERKSRFPTKARREAAAERLRQRREQARDGKHPKENPEKTTKKEEGESKLEKQQRKAEKLRLELEKAERKIQQEMSGAKRKRENGDEGDDDRGQVSEGDSDSSSGSDTDDKPETYSSRNSNPMRLPPPPKAQLQRHCKYFSTGGTCGKKGKCRFVHDQEVRNQALRDKEANGGKMTLAQRLILNDTAKDDLTILKSIQYLKEKGLMPEQLTSSAPVYDEESHLKSEENSYAENLNYGDN